MSRTAPEENATPPPPSLRSPPEKRGPWGAWGNSLVLLLALARRGERGFRRRAPSDCCRENAFAPGREVRNSARHWSVVGWGGVIGGPPFQSMSPTRTGRSHCIAVGRNGTENRRNSREKTHCKYNVNLPPCPHATSLPPVPPPCRRYPTSHVLSFAESSSTNSAASSTKVRSSAATAQQRGDCQQRVDKVL
jgi:hypothetical protein